MGGYYDKKELLPQKQNCFQIVREIEIMFALIVHAKKQFRKSSRVNRLGSPTQIYQFLKSMDEIHTVPTHHFVRIISYESIKMGICKKILCFVNIDGTLIHLWVMVVTITNPFCMLLKIICQCTLKECLCRR